MCIPNQLCTRGVVDTFRVNIEWNTDVEMTIVIGLQCDLSGHRHRRSFLPLLLSLRDMQNGVFEAGCIPGCKELFWVPGPERVAEIMYHDVILIKDPIIRFDMTSVTTTSGNLDRVKNFSAIEF
jgi:hypothetical protein